jgi:hypothetical protein
MFFKVEKIALTISGLEIVGTLFLSIIMYGRQKYYEGRIDVRKEIAGLTHLKD